MTSRDKKWKLADYRLKQAEESLEEKRRKVVLKTSSAEETFLLGERLGALMEPGDVLCVSGELGAGKTVLAKGLARGLGITAAVTSPTFTLINEYAGRLPFYHLDAYRLSNPAELADLGCEEYFYGAGVTLVEWAERVAEILPPERLDVRIENVAGEANARQIRLLPRGERYRCLVEELNKLVRARD
ncbi:MAG: tRNA (adenosine(37)-N6)-threonylcarbamoyltransferase complex ATPase subunit type 1 TsaE [Bacillota bacterium]